MNGSKKLNLKSCIWLLFLVLFVSSDALGQQAPNVTLDDPHNSVFVHLYYLQVDSYEPDKAAMAMTPGIDSLEAIKRAIQLKQILDGKGLYVQLNAIPRNNTYVDSINQEAYYVLFPKELPQVYLEKVNGKWYYSEETINLIPSLHRRVYPLGTDILLKMVPKSAQQRVLGLALWQYLGMVLILAFLVFANYILRLILNPIVKSFAKRKLAFLHAENEVLLRIAKVLSLLGILYITKICIPILQLPIKVAQVAQTGLKICITVFSALLFFRIIELITNYLKVLTGVTENKMDDQLIPIIDRIFKAIIIIAAVIQILRMLDVNVAALIAGVSIGGLALALAAQDTVKNFIGSIMIFIDKPFQIGDWIEGGNFQGTVKEVGFRSSRIQTSDTSIISVPNGKLANLSVVNRGVRVMRLLSTELSVTYSTPIQKIEAFIDRLKQIVIEHPHTNKEVYYVHLTKLADSSLVILFRIYLLVDNYANELIYKEEILMRVLKEAEDLGVDFAFPSSSVYIEKEPKK